MSSVQSLLHDIFSLSPSIEVFPIIHGSGDMAQEVRERMITGHFDCLAVPLPPSVLEPLETAIQWLPQIHVVVQPEQGQVDEPTVNFIPVDPCQPLIMGIRGAIEENLPREYIDRDVDTFSPETFVSPDPYALKQVSPAVYVAGILPSLSSPIPGSQQFKRISWMAFRLHELELYYKKILCLCHVGDWPWLREAYRKRQPFAQPDRPVSVPSIFRVAPSSLYFILGELPYITQLYEERRSSVHSDRTLSIDGLKELLLLTRSRWIERQQEEPSGISNWVTPQLLQRYLYYVRNLTLLDRRLTPDLYTLVLAAKQMAGDGFAITLLETAKQYVFQDQVAVRPGIESLAAGLGKMELPDGTLARGINRLQGPPLLWRHLSLRPQPETRVTRQWGIQWNPYRQCSWPPEDNKIESFTGHVREQAQSLLGADLVRTEKFTTSFKDGIDLRETLRHWNDCGMIGPRGIASKDIFVKEVPPSKGKVEAVIFLFDTPADPTRYSWCSTWHAEHQEESTLCFYATPFQDKLVGPGVAQSRYGGACFLFPPRPIPDIWKDSRLASLTQLEDRLIGGAALHSRERHLVLVSPIRPLSRWRRIARSFRKYLVSIPLNRFSGQTIDRMRRFHVLNGHDVRSYAAKFIRS